MSYRCFRAGVCAYRMVFAMLIGMSVCVVDRKQLADLFVTYKRREKKKHINRETL